MKTVIIAEAGVNHNGDIDLAREMIDVAAHAGADFVKFQLFTAENLTTAKTALAEYQLKSTMNSDSQLEMLQKLQINFKDYGELVDHARTSGIKLMSTAFDLPSLDFLLKLGQDIIKIPSGEITNYPLLRMAAESGRKIIISTGMSTITEIKTAVEVLKTRGVEDENLTLLQCTSSYPTSMQDAHLKVIPKLREVFDLEVGFSDHTIGVEASISAVALGASIIEKHFTLDKSQSGPDHSSSIDPEELQLLVKSIRNIESALGNENKVLLPSEFQNRLLARKSIVASKKIQKGEVFSEANLTSKRPGYGISPMAWEILLGTTAQMNYEVDDFI